MHTRHRLIAVAIAGIIWICGWSGAAAHRSPQAPDSNSALRAAGSPPSFPLKLSPDRRYLVDARGTSVLVHGDAAWSLLVQLSTEDADRYLEDRRHRGINLIVVNLLEHKFCDHPPNNVYGDGPFTTPGDFSTPNEWYFAHADTVIRHAADRGIAVLLAPAYLGVQGGDEGWYQEMVANGAARMKAWGSYVGARYRSFDNVLWLEGGDFAPPTSGLALVNAVVSGIKSQDTKHLQVAHWSPGMSGGEVAVDWIDVGSTYTYAPTYLKCLDDYTRTQGRASILIESRYENESGSTPESLRAQAYGALLSGAVGQIFGNSETWKFTREWASALGSSGNQSMTHVHDLFSALPWTTLVPDRDHRTLTAGYGTYGTVNYSPSARGSDGRIFVAYVPEVRSVTVDLSQLTGSVRARWFDPASGAFTEIEGSPFRNTAPLVSVPPGPNTSGGRDWLLVLDVR